MSEKASKPVNDRPPNWRTDGKLFLRRCYACDEKHGKENYALAVASGQCAFCGWKDEEKQQEAGK
jgi:hypothetical protein